MITLIERATNHTERIAIISNGSTYNYQDLLTKAKQIALALLEGNEDLTEERVTFLVDPGFDYVATQWGIWLAGGIAVPLCVLHPVDSMAYVIEDTASKVLIVEHQYKSKLSTLAAKFEMKVLDVEKFDQPSDGSLPTVDPQRSAMILYTSGTTSKPKGVVSTHFNIESQIKTLVHAWEWDAEDHILNILPLHHVHGIINVMSCALWTGACCEFLPKFNAEKVWQVFQSKRLTLFMAVPTIYYKLITHYESAIAEQQLQMRQSFSGMRLMVSGSAALPVSVLEKWKNITGHTLLERYGMTEIGMGLSNPYRGERRPGHVGLPLPGVSIRLVDEENKEVPEGQPGEIQIKSNAIFKEYWNKPKPTQEAFVEGWFKTGDIAQLNDGYYKILGRDSVDIIKSGGYKISALEIEEVLRKHPAILECAVVGIPNEEWGEIIGAGLVLKEDNSPTEDLKDWLSDKLPGYKIPRRYLSLSKLPRNTLGKVTKKQVVQLFQVEN